MMFVREIVCVCGLYVVQFCLSCEDRQKWPRMVLSLYSGGTDITVLSILSSPIPLRTLISLNKELLIHLSLLIIHTNIHMYLCMWRNTRVRTRSHLCVYAHAQPKVIDWKFLQTKLISQSTEPCEMSPLPLLRKSPSCQSPIRQCVFVGEWQSIVMSVCVCVCERDEARHDETDIDMLTRAKESCEKYLIST